MNSAPHCESAQHFRPRRGFTLVEAVVSVLIVAVMLVAALNTFGGVGRAALVQHGSRSADALRWEMLTEVLQVPYEDFDEPGEWGLEAGESATPRSGFDDVDDYDGWSASPPQSRDGAPLADYRGWTRKVGVINVEPYGLSASGSTDWGLRMIEVTVEDPEGNQTVDRALRSRWGVGEKLPAEEMTCVVWTEVELQIGNKAAGRAESAANLANNPSGE